MGDFRKLLLDIKEEVTSGDIATVDSKVGSKPLKHLHGKGKKCKQHKRFECLDCQRD